MRLLLTLPLEARFSEGEAESEGGLEVEVGEEHQEGEVGVCGLDELLGRPLLKSLYGGIAVGVRGPAVVKYWAWK